MPKPATVRRVPPYRGERYWEKEEPQEAMTDRIALAYFPQAGKLQISLLWPDRETGEKRRGKTVTLDYEDLQAHPDALDLLSRVAAEWL
jgi:hypothetical protein